MKKRKMCIAVAACIVLALGVIATAEGPDNKTASLTRGTPIATEAIGPTSLSIQSRVDYSRAVVNISGPNGLRLSTAFPGDEKVHVDLLKADWEKPRARRSKVNGAKEKPEAFKPPNGRYRYEIHFFKKGSKTRYFSGQFFVENGAAVSRATVRSRQKEARQDLAKPGRERNRGGTNPSEDLAKSIAYGGYLYIYPFSYPLFSPNTWMSLGGYDPYGYYYYPYGYIPTYATATFLNYQGDIVIGEGNYGGVGYPDPFYPHMTISRQSTYYQGSRVGIGTFAPSATLDMVGPYWAGARLSTAYYGQSFVLENWGGNFDIWDQNASSYPLVIEPGLPSGTTALWIQDTGRVGVGTSNPSGPLDVAATATSIGFGNAAARLANSAGGVAFQLDADGDGATFWNFSSIGGDAAFRISKSGTGVTEMALSQTGDLEISGDLTVVGGCTGCDAVFNQGYDLESIEDHAEFMWENGFLPGVGPTAEGKTKIRVFEKTAGILNELEKAHIYIEQLHQYTDQQREHSLQQEKTIRELETRLEALERAIKAE